MCDKHVQIGPLKKDMADKGPTPSNVLGVLEVTANIYCESRNLPNTDM